MPTPATPADTLPADHDPHRTQSLSASGPAVPVVAAGPDAERELFRVVRSRLRQAFVLFLLFYAAFLARDAFDRRPSSRHQVFILGVAVGCQAVIVAFSRSRLFRRRVAVRTGEWATLLVFAGTMGANQFVHMTDPAWAASLNAADPRDSQILMANTWLIPWLALTVGYPVVVPNPWRRALVLAVVMAAVPCAVTFAAMAAAPQLTFANTAYMFVQFAIWGGLVGVGIAAYAAFQGELLRKEAFEAKQFGQYVLRERLGAGGMGEVYLAEHRLLKRPSVIKLIRPDKAADPNMTRRFEREVKLLATLTHWNTVDVYDYGHTPDGTFYYVMEYLPGLNLQDLVTAYGPVPPARAVHLIRQVCAGLREAHAAGLIHRDVKPDNVMTVRRGGLADLAKLLDFGLVQGPDDARTGTDNGRLTREGAFLGTPLFMSPEQAGGTAADPRSDIYALGCTLYYVLTGKPPFERPGIVAVLAAHLLETPIPPRTVNPNVPADLDRVVMTCLEKSPADRYASVHDLARALAACACAADWDDDRAAAWWAEHRDAKQ